METIGQRIAEERKKAGMTQAQLAAKLNVTPQNISQYERGIKNPKIGTLNKIANALGVPITELDPSAIHSLRFIPIGKRIENERIAQGVSVEELASRLGISPEKVREYERGDVVPSKHTMCLIADGLGVKAIMAFYPVMNEMELQKGIEEISEIFSDKETEEEGKEYIQNLCDGKSFIRGLRDDAKYFEIVPFYAAEARHSSNVEKCPIYSKMNTLLDKLNEEGQRKAIERVEELTEIPRYQLRTDGEEAKPDKDPE